MAKELGLDLFVIDLSQVVSKYIGETEKNLRRVFDAAERGGALLLFDEADALFGKRSEVKDSHDRYANLEVSYLLMRMEAYRGLAVLTTNMKKALDTAFLRRIRFVVDFPFPAEHERAEIWRRVLPARAPVKDLDPALLAQLTVAGGSIRNIALSGAFLAAEEGEALQMRHMLAAARAPREPERDAAFLTLRFLGSFGVLGAFRRRSGSRTRRLKPRREAGGRTPASGRPRPGLDEGLLAVPAGGVALLGLRVVGQHLGELPGLPGRVPVLLRVGGRVVGDGRRGVRVGDGDAHPLAGVRARAVRGPQLLAGVPLHGVRDLRAVRLRQRGRDVRAVVRRDGPAFPNTAAGAGSWSLALALCGALSRPVTVRTAPSRLAGAEAVAAGAR
ncbi:hypothetical protein SGLAM104S_09339 [Streptomyces glaucescens]